MEILSHEASAIRMDFVASGRAPLLMDHNFQDQIGVIESVELGDDKVLRSVVRFGRSPRAQEILDDVHDGIRANISVTYRIHTYQPLPNDEGYRITDWEPLEFSFVSVPADQSVGVGRDYPSTQTTGLQMDAEELARQQREAEARRVEAERLHTERMQSVQAAAEQRGAALGDAMVLAARHNLRSEVDTFLTPALRQQSGDAILAAVRGFVLERIGTGTPLVDSNIGLTQVETRSFSLTRLIAAIDPAAQAPERRAAAFELQACEAAAEKASEVGAHTTRGFRLPFEIMLNWDMGGQRSATGQRVLNTADDAALVPTEHLAGSFIDILRKRSAVLRAGVTILNGLSGNLEIPRQATSSVATWVSAEHGDATVTEPTFENISLTPHDLACYVDMSRRMLQQSAPGIEGLIRRDIVSAFQLGLDLTILEGAGSSGIPRGVRNVTGINKPTGFVAANPTYAEIVALETAIDDDEALDGNLAYIGRTAMRGALKVSPLVSGFPSFIMPNPGELNGYPFYPTNQITSGNLYFGNWANVLLGLWSGLEINVDTAALALKGGRRIIAFQTADVAVRHPESFAWNRIA